MNDYKSLIEQGERAREQGNPSGAISILEEALAITTVPSEQANAICHLGLCYDHLGQLTQAEELFLRALHINTSENNTAGIARAKRHLVSVKLKSGQIAKALSLAKEARQHILTLGKQPADMVWFTHGVVTVLIQGKYPKRMLQNWVLNEWHELRHMSNREKNPIARAVWTTGWMGAAMHAWPLTAIVLWPTAMFIALRYGLKVRIQQLLPIDKIMGKKR